jgi:hypothetical protein
MALNMLLLTAPHERGEIRLFNVAGLRGLLRSAGSKNLERTVPMARALHDWMEVGVRHQALGFLNSWLLGFLVAQAQSSDFLGCEGP